MSEKKENTKTTTVSQDNSKVSKASKIEKEEWVVALHLHVAGKTEGFRKALRFYFRT